MNDATADTGDPFSLRTVAILVLVGVAGLVAMLGLLAFAPQLRGGDNGGGHALSNGATGFAGLVRLSGETGRHPHIVRNARDFDTGDLLVITPEHGTVQIGPAMSRGVGQTLVVLPKWQTVPDPDHAGWVRSDGLLPLAEPAAVTAPEPAFTLARRPAEAGMALVGSGSAAGTRLRAPAQLQVITGIDAAHSTPGITWQPLIGDGHGGVVLARLYGRDDFVLSDPDLIDNQALDDEGRAAAALALLDALRGQGGIAFDVSLNGLGEQRNPLTLLVVPPFAGATACLALALLLAGVAAFARFGPVVPRPRAIAFGKAALIDNAALMVRKAGLEPRMGARYAAMAAQIGGPPDPALAAAAVAATNREALLDAAQALYDAQIGGRGEKTG